MDLGTIDIAVVGGGMAGMVAANRAAELGARVAVFEAGSEAKYRANSRFTGGVFHIAFRDIEAPPATLLAAIEKATGPAGDPRQAQALAQDGGRLVRWLAEHGAVFDSGGELEFMRKMLVPFSLREPGFANHWRDKGADRLLDRLEQQLAAHGGRLHRGMRARQLRMADGRCTGLTLEAATGAAHQVACQAVILCDGGFQGDAELVRRYISPRPQALLRRGAGTGVGDGLRMAEAVGANLVNMDKFYGHVQCAEALGDESLWPYPILDIVASATVVVDGRGRRFTDEGLGGVALANAVAKLEDPLSSFVVMTEAQWASIGREFLLPPNPTIEERGARVLRAPTVADQAQQMGVPASALQDTLADYNRAVATGRTAALQPPRSGQAGTLARAAVAVQGGPYVAIRMCAGITYTMGGIAIDGDGRALDLQGQPIAGLYAAGSTTGGLEGGALSGYVGGLAKAAVFGLRAGEAAVRDRLH